MQQSVYCMHVVFSLCRNILTRSLDNRRSLLCPHMRWDTQYVVLNYSFWHSCTMDQLWTIQSSPFSKYFRPTEYKLQTSCFCSVPRKISQEEWCDQLGVLLWSNFSSQVLHYVLAKSRLIGKAREGKFTTSIGTPWDKLWYLDVWWRVHNVERHVNWANRICPKLCLACTFLLAGRIFASDHQQHLEYYWWSLFRMMKQMSTDDAVQTCVSHMCQPTSCIDIAWWSWCVSI